MSIQFHCEHCGKKIEAPDNAGGKQGRCPACKKKVYVPSAELDDEVRLAPLDTEEEQRRAEMLAEAARLRKDIMSETEVPDEPRAGAQTSQPAAVEQPTALSDEDLPEVIRTYLRLMADGELEEAEKTAGYIVASGPRALKILDRLALSEIPEPALADVPAQVLSGLIRNLRNRIGRN